MRDAAFGCDWVGTAIPFQRCLMFIIAAANKEFQLTAGKFVPVSNLTMINVGKINILYIFFTGHPSLMGPGVLRVEFSLSHSDTHRSVELLWRSDQPDAQNSTRNTQHSQETDFHDSGGIRNRHCTKRTAAIPDFRPRGNQNVLGCNATNIL